MKNAILMGLTAAILFAISAGLSLWLNQAKPEEEPPPTTEKISKRKSKHEDAQHDHESPPRPLISLPTSGDVSDAARLAERLQSEMVRTQRREEELLRQQDVYRFALEDIRQEMATLQALWKKLLEQPASPPTPPKPATAPAPKLDTPPPPQPIKPNPDVPDPKTLGTIKGISESMAPDAAARIVEQMARGGKLDVAAMLLTKMSPRQAAKVLAAISDEQLSQQVFEKMLEVRQP